MIVLRILCDTCRDKHATQCLLYCWPWIILERTFLPFQEDCKQLFASFFYYAGFYSWHPYGSYEELEETNSMRDYVSKSKNAFSASSKNRHKIIYNDRTIPLYDWDIANKKENKLYLLTQILFFLSYRDNAIIYLYFHLNLNSTVIYSSFHRLFLIACNWHVNLSFLYNNFINILPRKLNEKSESFYLYRRMILNDICT